MRAYVAAHDAVLQEEVQQQRAVVAQRWAAHETQQRSRVVPNGLAEWVQFLQKHESDFRTCMETASVERRKRSRRLVAAPDMPEGVPRLQPQAHKWRPPVRGWGKIVWGRSGWHALGRKGEVKIFFLYSHNRQTYFLDMTHCRTDEGNIFVNHKFSVSELLRHIRVVEEPSIEADVPVHELTMTATATEDGVCLRPTKVRVLGLSTSRPKQPQAPADGEESEDSLDAWIPLDSIPSSKGSVDTDVEEDDDEEDDGMDVGCEEDELATTSVEAAPATTGAHAAALDADLGEGIEPSSGDERPQRIRHAAGTYVVWTNGYFFLSSNPDKAP